MLLTALTGITAQTNYDYSKIHRERLNRGVVAVKTADGHVAVSWRTLTSDPKGAAYDVFRNGTKLNREPLTTGGTFFIDEYPIEDDATYEVRCQMEDGRSEMSDGKCKVTDNIGYLTT